jgi:hypothetical protein
MQVLSRLFNYSQLLAKLIFRKFLTVLSPLRGLVKIANPLNRAGEIMVDLELHFTLEQRAFVRRYAYGQKFTIE